MSTWSCKITWQTKTIISSLPQCLWLPNLARWWLTLTVEGLLLSKSRHILIMCLARSSGKLKTYLHYLIAYGHQTWLSNELQWAWRAPAQKSHEISSEITWQIKYVISPFSRINDYQKWLASDILWGACSHKVIGSFNHMLN